MQYTLKLNSYTLILNLDCQFGDEEFLINGYDIKKLTATNDFTDVGGGITTDTFTKNIYPDFIEMYHKDIIKELNYNALEISELYHEHKKETAY